MKQRFDVIVAGAGASGLMAGIQAARHGAAVLILEHMDRAGKRFWPQETENVILPMKSRALRITEARTLPLSCLRWNSSDWKRPWTFSGAGCPPGQQAGRLLLPCQRPGFFCSGSIADGMPAAEGQHFI